MPVYWKPKYGTRSSRHRAWVRQQVKRESARRDPPVPFRKRLLRLFGR